MRRAIISAGANDCALPDRGANGAPGARSRDVNGAVVLDVLPGGTAVRDALPGALSDSRDDISAHAEKYLPGGAPQRVSKRAPRQ